MVGWWWVVAGGCKEGAWGVCVGMPQVDVVLAVMAAPTARRDVHGAYTERQVTAWWCARWHA
eukprot:6673778-Prorocentrum_lima.AAC.1